MISWYICLRHASDTGLNITETGKEVAERLIVHEPRRNRTRTSKRRTNREHKYLCKIVYILSLRGNITVRIIYFIKLFKYLFKDLAFMQLF